MLIKNVLSHADDLHDGRPIGPYATAEISADAFELPHYQSRIRDGLMVVVTGTEPSGDSDPGEKLTAPKGAKPASNSTSEETGE